MLWLQIIIWADIQRRGSILAWIVICLFMAQTQTENYLEKISMNNNHLLEENEEILKKIKHFLRLSVQIKQGTKYC